MKTKIKIIIFIFSLFIFSDIINANEIRITKTENSSYIIYNVNDIERNLTYSWKFKKNYQDLEQRINDSLKLDIDLRLDLDKVTSTTKEINDIFKQKKLIISFDYHGELPETATVKLYVGNKFKNNENLYLYYYNDLTRDVELISSNIKVVDGYVSFDIEHCSEYFLTAAVVNSNKKSIAVNNFNVIIISLTLAIFLLLGYILIKSNK